MSLMDRVRDTFIQQIHRLTDRSRISKSGPEKEIYKRLILIPGLRLESHNGDFYTRYRYHYLLGVKT